MVTPEAGHGTEKLVTELEKARPSNAGVHRCMDGNTGKGRGLLFCLRKQGRRDLKKKKDRS